MRVERLVSERAKEIAESVARWAGEAWREWAESVKDSPEAHCYTLLMGGLLTVIAQWFL